MKKQIKKSVSAIIATTMACSMLLASCGGNGGDKTVISIMNFEGGVGTVWLDDAVTRFEATHQDIDVKVFSGQGTASHITAGSGYNMVVIERLMLNNYVAGGLLLDISDVYTDEDSTLDERIYPEIKSRYQFDGAYYGVPHYEFYSGFTYDKESFDSQYLYFADSSSGELFMSDFGDAYFVSQSYTAKSIGPDGEKGTQDDGLPCSLQELLILCARMKKKGMEPIQLTGKYLDEINYLLAGLWPSLAGYEEIKTVYSMDSSNCPGQDGIKGTEDDGKVEVIKTDANGKLMFSDEPLFVGNSQIKKPITEWVEITLDNGYLTNDLASKYYAAAFVEAAEKAGFFSEDSYDEGVSHTGAEKTFIYGEYSGKAKGLLIEASYWWNESEMAGNMEDYKKISRKDTRDVRWMPLPTSVNDTVTEGNGEKTVLNDAGFASIVVNANIANNKPVVDACIEFLKFLYTEEECAKYTESTACFRPVEYDVDIANSDKSIYFKDLVELRQKSNVVMFGAENNNAAFREIGKSLCLDLSANCFSMMENGSRTWLLNAIRAKNKTAADWTNGTRIDSTTWNYSVSK